jgi:hypothetical protein
LARAYTAQSQKLSFAFGSTPFVTGFLIRDDADETTIGSDYGFVKGRAFRLVIENGDERWRVYDGHRGKPKSSYPMISSMDLGSTTGRAALRTAMASMPAINSSLVIFCGGGATELR